MGRERNGEQGGIENERGSGFIEVQDPSSSVRLTLSTHHHSSEVRRREKREEK